MIWIVLVLIVGFFVTSAVGGLRFRGSSNRQRLPGGLRPLFRRPESREAPPPTALPEPSSPPVTNGPVTLEGLQDDFAEGRISVEEYEARLDALFSRRDD